MCFGHMHHVLYGGKAMRTMVAVDGDHDTVYINAATVPRVRKRPESSVSSSSGSGSGSGGRLSKRKTKALSAAVARGPDVSGGGGPPTQHYFMVVEVSTGDCRSNAKAEGHRSHENGIAETASTVKAPSWDKSTAAVEEAKDVWVDVEEAEGGSSQPFRTRVSVCITVQAEYLMGTWEVHGSEG